MQLNVPSELEPFIDQEFSTGRYSTREEVVVYALAWFRNERQQSLEGITDGLSDLDAGNIEPLSDVIAELRSSLPKDDE
ncbi:MAG: hypothetical protein KDB03_04955 [Planctomycetales bacterium]|nr:hypothetical protein [Planctomycetales bacterium]